MSVVRPNGAKSIRKEKTPLNILAWVYHYFLLLSRKNSTMEVKFNNRQQFATGIVKSRHIPNIRIDIVKVSMAE